jgi:hypothetical protein
MALFTTVKQRAEIYIHVVATSKIRFALMVRNSGLAIRCQRNAYGARRRSFQIVPRVSQAGLMCQRVRITIFLCIAQWKWSLRAGTIGLKMIINVWHWRTWSYHFNVIQVEVVEKVASICGL